MKFIIRAVVILLLTTQAVLGQSIKYQVAERVKTDDGEVQFAGTIHAKGFVSPPSTILLNKKVIFEADPASPFLSFIGIYRTDAGQALLFRENCGGSGCRIDPLRLILLEKHLRPQIIANDDFFSETIAPDRIRGEQKEGKIVFDLGYERGSKKTAVFEKGRLSVSMTDDTVRVLPNYQCAMLYFAADACIREHNSKIGCTDYSHADFTAGGFSGSNAETWAVRSVAHYPGFNREAFIGLCNAMCRSSDPISFEQFKLAACTNSP